MKTLIRSILKYLITNAKELCKNKHSGVYEFEYEKLYTIHINDFIPNFMYMHPKTKKVISELVSNEFANELSWNSDTLWLKIQKEVND